MGSLATLRGKALREMVIRLSVLMDRDVSSSAFLVAGKCRGEPRGPPGCANPGFSAFQARRYKQHGGNLVDPCSIGNLIAVSQRGDKT